MDIPKAVIRGDLPPPPAPSPMPLPPDVVILPTYRLYSPGQAALATFLGSPIAGFWLIGRNYKRLGRPGMSWAMLGCGIAMTGVLVLCGLAFSGGGLLLSGGSIALVSMIAQGVHGEALLDHLRRGGRAGSWGVAVGAGFASMAIVLGLAFGGGVAYVLLSEPPSITFGPMTVAYDDGTTEEDARSVGVVLADIGLTKIDHDANMKIRRDHGRAVLTFIVTDTTTAGEWFHQQAEQFSSGAFGGAEVDIELADETWTVVQRLPWEARPHRLAFDTDVIWYGDGINEAQARAVAAALTTAGMFGSKREGVAAKLSRRGRVTLTFSIGDNTLSTDIRDYFHRLAKPVSNALENTPVDIVLTDGEGKQRERLSFDNRPPDQNIR